MNDEQIEQITTVLGEIWAEAKRRALVLRGHTDLAEKTRSAKERYDVLDRQISVLASSPDGEDEAVSAQMTRLVSERDEAETDWLAALIAIDEGTAQQRWLDEKFGSENEGAEGERA